MPDESRYDNKGIESALRRSAVVIIGLSPSYLKSERCASAGMYIPAWPLSIEHTICSYLYVKVHLMWSIWCTHTHT